MKFEHQDVKLPDLETITKMLLRENELRLSSEFQQRLESNSELTAESLYDELQRQVAREFGFVSEEQQRVGRDIIRCTTELYKQQADLSQLSLYRKYNRSEQGLLKVGDDCPDMELSDLEGSATKLSNFTNQALPMVLVAGSYT